MRIAAITFVVCSMVVLTSAHPLGECAANTQGVIFKGGCCKFCYKEVPISTLKILKKTGLTTQAHVFIAEFPHPPSTQYINVHF